MTELAAVAPPDISVRHLIHIMLKRRVWGNGLTLRIEANERVQPRLVRHDYLLIGRNDYVEFNDIDPKGEGVQKTRQGIFGTKATAAAVPVHFHTQGSGRCIE